MIAWRLRQLLFRNRLTQVCLAITLVFTLLAGFLITRQAPYFVLVFAAMVSGIFLSLTLAFQLQDDLSYAWAERCLGVSHAEVIATFETMGGILGLSLGSVFALLFCGSGLVLTPDAGLHLLSQGVKLGVLAALASLLMPHLMFQIDPHRPAIQIVLVTLGTLFIGTAIFAHWLGVILIPALRYYAMAHQLGRFYRA